MYFHRNIDDYFDVLMTNQTRARLKQSHSAVLELTRNATCAALLCSARASKNKLTQGGSLHPDANFVSSQLVCYLVGQARLVNLSFKFPSKLRKPCVWAPQVGILQLNQIILLVACLAFGIQFCCRISKKLLA